MTNGNASTAEIIWRPQAGPQKALIDCPLPEILFGGARGGGKTDGILGKWAIKAKRLAARFNAVFFRKEMPQQDDLIDRSKEIYGKLNAHWHEQKKSWMWPNGARIRFRPLESVQDAEKYQGQNLSDACVEEAGNYASSDPIDRLFGCLRGGNEIQLILTANPGGPGHTWIKNRYIDPCPDGMRVLKRNLPNGGTHSYTYIPSRVEDNRVLLANDPGYVNRLYLVGSENLVSAWLKGDWNVIEGAFFENWNTEKHVVQPFDIPSSWARLRSADWGSAKPFSIGWWAIAGEQTQSGPVTIPRGCMVRYREWYGAKSPNVGLKLTAEQVAEGIAALETGETIADAILDPSAFAENGGPSIAERMWMGSRIKFRPADNSRIAQRGAMGGWDQMRSRLNGDADGNAMLVAFSTCRHFIRTVPSLQHDPLRAEDLDTDGEDHAADEARYACMSRPWTPPIPAKREPERVLMVGPENTATLNDAWAEQKRQRSSRI
jgi:hypothetical protein